MILRKALKITEMKSTSILFILLLLAWSLSAHSYDSFSLREVNGFGYTKSVGKSKKTGTVRVVKTLRDSEGEAFVLLHSKGAFPVIGGRTSSIMAGLLQDDNLFTIAHLDREGKAKWFFHLNNRTNKSLALQDLSISPQGNIALVVKFKGNLKFLGEMKEYNSINEDLVFFFLNKSNGSLIKDLHFSGTENEVNGKVIWGTGGEMLLTLLSDSKKVTYDNGFYIFNQRYDKPVMRELLVRLKKTFFPMWERSLEPAALKGLTFFDKDRVFLSFTHGGIQQGLYRQGGSISRHVKGRRDPMRGIGLALDGDGNKMWSVTLKDQSYGGDVGSTKEFPDGTLGLMGHMQGKSLSVGSQRNFSSDEKKSKDLFLRFNHKGLLEKSALILSPQGVSLYPTSSQDTLFYSGGALKENDLSFEVSGGNSTSFSLSKDPNCKTLFVVGEDFEVISVMDSTSCEAHSSLNIDSKDLLRGHIHLASGHLEALFLHQGNIALKKIKYGAEILNDEIIPGLSYRPNFFHEKEGGKDTPKYSLSYAIPKKVVGAMALFVPKGMDHLQALRNPLYQVTLNLAYMRGYVPVTVWTEEESLVGERLEELFKKLSDKKVLDKKWPWLFMASEERAAQVNSLYKAQEHMMGNVVSPKLLVFWNMKEIPDEDATKEKREELVKRSRDTLFMTSWDREDLEKKSHLLYLEFDRQKKKSSHIIAETQKVRANFFSAIDGMGMTKSQEYFNELKTKDCLDKNGFLKDKPQSLEFKGKCFNDTKTVESLSPASKDRLFSFLQEIYSPQTMVPFYDKEIFNFFEGVK